MNKFSIIVPVYNSLRYLPQCVDSLVQQTFNKEDMEVILVNDGSTDGSKELCERYSEEYPFVVCINQENAGASRARNKGIEVATGDFIGFVDSDDWISINLIERVAAFFNNCSDNGGVAVCPVYNMYGNRKKPHYANGRFSKGTRVVSLNRPEWQFVVSRIAPTFFRSAIAKKVLLDETVRYYEDTKYCSEALMDSMLLGIVSGCAYYYRRNSGDDGDLFSSVTSGATANPSFYIDSPQKVSLDVLEKVNEQFGLVPLYYQFAALGEMKWRIFYNNDSPVEVLSSADYQCYVNLNSRIMSYIDDDAILRCGLYSEWQRAYLLSVKHEQNILLDAKYDETGALVWQNNVIYYAPSKTRVLLSSLSDDSGTVVVRGFFTELLDGEVEIYALVNGKRRDFDSEYVGPRVTKFLLENEEYIAVRRAFELRFSPGEDSLDVRFGFKICGRAYEVKDLGISSTVDIAPLRPVERVLGDRIIKRTKNGLNIRKVTMTNLSKMYGAKVKRAFRRKISSMRKGR